LKARQLYIIIIGLAFIFGCSSSKKSTNKNVAGIYMPGLNLIDPEYKVFHKNDTITEFYFRLNSENILYTKKRDDSTFSANILIKYELTESSLNALSDSASISFTDFGSNKQKKYLEGKISLPTQLNRTYSLVVNFNDVTRDHYIKKRVLIDRSNTDNEQNYLILDTLNNVIFKNHFNTNDNVVLKKSKSNADSKITLKFYKSNYPIAKPPFSTTATTGEANSFSPEFTEEYAFDSLNTIRYTITDKGLYHFKSENSKSGPTLFNFQENFPAVKNLENMIGPMRYISTIKEYTFLNESENTKKAVDDFWLDVSGSNDRARTLIREYYNRVENANNYFTSYLEGWKTDRGIVYIIYGTPNVVYKNKDYENWIYGEENNMMSISFVFYKVANPISDNDFSLSRSPIFKNSWFRAVDSWRSGRIY
jgi:GWxTD domain-containing protein